MYGSSIYLLRKGDLSNQLKYAFNSFPFKQIMHRDVSQDIIIFRNHYYHHDHYPYQK